MLQELKIARDWAFKKREDANGGKITYPDRYAYADNLYKKVQEKFDDACEQFITNLADSRNPQVPTDEKNNTLVN